MLLFIWIANMCRINEKKWNLIWSIIMNGSQMISNQQQKVSLYNICNCWWFRSMINLIHSFATFLYCVSKINVWFSHSLSYRKNSSLWPIISSVFWSHKQRATLSVITRDGTTRRDILTVPLGTFLQNQVLSILGIISWVHIMLGELNKYCNHAAPYVF